MLRQPLSLLSLFILLLLACNLPIGLVATPTATPASPLSPTAIVEPSPLPTETAGATATPSSIPSPSPVEATATPASTLPPDLPPEAILILSPGPGSRVTGSVLVTGLADSTFENNLVIEVRDVNGNVVGMTPVIISAEPGGRGPFAAAVAFTSPGEVTPGRVAVYHASARDGHLIHLASVVVILLPSGSAQELKPGLDHPEDVVIHMPALLDVVSGGTVHVSGYAAPTFEQNLLLAVLDENGVEVGVGFTTIQTSMGEPGPFDADVPYSVTHEQPGSVQVYATSPLDGGIEHLASVEVILQP